MKKLLIHSNNTPLNTDKLFSLPEQFVFEVDLDKDVDFYIHEKLAIDAELAKKINQSDVVYIKVSLSGNYLEYFGLRLAYHIRLADSLKEKVTIPIVFLAEETVQFLGATSSDPMILFSQGVYVIKDTLEAYKKSEEWISQGIIKPLGSFDQFIETINIKAPASYRSHHSITNEWSILRWANVLGVSSKPEFGAVKDNIEKLLYYKYLSKKYPISIAASGPVLEITGKGKILYIDDEWKKGWNIIFKNIFNNGNLKFETLEKDFKDQTRQEIIDLCIAKVQAFDPDVVLLDLRLADDDFNGLKCEEMTGYKVLEAIKTINPGIHVIIFTASNKVWNLNALQIARSDGFLLKESPELSIDEDYTANSLEQLAGLISQGLDMAFLKDIIVKMNHIEGISTGLVGEEKDEFKDRLTINFDVAFSLLKQAKFVPKFFNYAFLQLFQIIEDFATIPSVFSGSTTCYVGDTSEGILVRKDFEGKTTDAIKFNEGKYIIEKAEISFQKSPNTNFIVSSLIIFRIGQATSTYLKWNKIYKIRNQKAAHFSTISDINENDIAMILTFIENFIDVSSVSNVNSGKGLKEDSLANKLKELTSKK